MSFLPYNKAIFSKLLYAKVIQWEKNMRKQDKILKVLLRERNTKNKRNFWKRNMIKNTEI